MLEMWAERKGCPIWFFGINRISWQGENLINIGLVPSSMDLSRKPPTCPHAHIFCRVLRFILHLFRLQCFGPRFQCSHYWWYNRYLSFLAPHSPTTYAIDNPSNFSHSKHSARRTFDFHFSSDGSAPSFRMTCSRRHHVWLLQRWASTSYAVCTFTHQILWACPRKPGHKQL